MILCGWEVKAGMAHSAYVDEKCGRQVKPYDASLASAVPERLKDYAWRHIKALYFWLFRARLLAS